MFETIKKILGLSAGPDFERLLKEGAKLIDVRTRNEFNAGHLEGSINVPLNELHSMKSLFSPDTVIITCCASGIRSASAMNVLKGLGFTKVYNGGGWIALKTKLAFS